MWGTGVSVVDPVVLVILSSMCGTSYWAVHVALHIEQCVWHCIPPQFLPECPRTTLRYLHKTRVGRGHSEQTFLPSWIKRDQLDVTCFIISLFTAQHVSDVNTSILRSLWLICWVISWVVLLCKDRGFCISSQYLQKHAFSNNHTRHH